MTLEKLPTEELFYFKNSNNKNLFGFLHTPSQEKNKKIGVIICNPIFEERIFAYRFLVNFARSACQHGYGVLQFDYYGYGDSEGEAEEVTITSMLTDLEDACRVFKTKYNFEKLCILGLRFGGTLAAKFCDNSNSIKNIILWNPIIDGEQYIKRELRKTITVQTTAFKKILLTRDNIIENIQNNISSVIDGYNLASIDGYPLTKKMYTEAISENILNYSWEGGDFFLGFLRKPKKRLGKEELKFIEFVKILDTNISLKVIEESVVFWGDNLYFKNICEPLYQETINFLETI